MKKTTTEKSDFFKTHIQCYREENICFPFRVKMGETKNGEMENGKSQILKNIKFSNLRFNVFYRKSTLFLKRKMKKTKNEKTLNI